MSLNDELINDDLPSPPAEGASGPAIDAEFDASLLADVPKMGDAIPQGTYVFRLEKVYEQWNTKDFDTGRDLPESEHTPSFGLQWRCQVEPYVGRVVLENVPWIRPEDVKIASDPQNPGRADAKARINKVMPRAKQIMEAANYNPTGKFNFKEFLATNPELKLQLGVRQKKVKDQNTGKWVDSGEWKNTVVKHLSISRPA